MSIQVKDANGTTQTVETLPVKGATTAANSLPVVHASDDPLISAVLTNTQLRATPLPIAPTASEVHLGEIGGKTVVGSALPVTSLTAYASGSVMGSKLTFSNFGRIVGGTGLIQMVGIHSKSAQTFTCDLVLFHTDPASSTFTDNAALSVNAADFDKVLGVIHITDWTNLGGPSFAEATQLAMAYKVATGASDIYGVLVARGAATLASTSDLKVIAKALLD